MLLATNYLGLRLRNPLIVGASPMAGDLDTVRRLEDLGAAAIVLHSLFEEEIERDLRLHLLVESFEESYSEALSYLPEMDGYHVGPYRYLELIRRTKEAVRMPVIASLNGTTSGGWTHYARLMEAAGADAIELNFYHISAEIAQTGQDVEQMLIDTIREVRSTIHIPLAVKISPFYSALGNLAMNMADAGAAGVVLFNRFYQPDLDIQQMRVVPNIRLSTSDELTLRIRWAALLHARVPLSIGISGGVHTPTDVVKAIMAGANAVQVVSCLLKNGVDYLEVLRKGLREWMDENEYYALEDMQGCMSARRSPNPAAYERANYIRTIDSWPHQEFQDKRPDTHVEGDGAGMDII